MGASPPSIPSFPQFQHTTVGPTSEYGGASRYLILPSFVIFFSIFGFLKSTPFVSRSIYSLESCFGSFVLLLFLSFVFNVAVPAPPNKRVPTAAAAAAFLLKPTNKENLSDRHPFSLFASSLSSLYLRLPAARKGQTKNISYPFVWPLERASSFFFFFFHFHCYYHKLAVL